MSQNHSGNYLDYMDGVPVKVSEKYKPPPIITLPHGIIESTAKSAEAVESINYDFSLENKVLKKLIEWQNTREKERNERNHRLQLLEEARQREIDLKIATENEEKLKQLSISEVSYPSTEEISEISPDDTEESKEKEPTVPISLSHASDQMPCQNITNSEGHSENPLLYGNFMANMYLPNRYIETKSPDINSDILKPTPVSPLRICAPMNLLDDPDPIQKFQQSISSKNHSQLHYVRPSYMQNNVENLTFSDFENDTSSPFDNMELKTMNDLELLAEVLNHNQTIVHHTHQDENYAKQPLLNQSTNGFIPTQTYSNTHSTHNDVYSPKSTYFNNSQDLSSTAQPSFTFVPSSMPINNSYFESGGNKSSFSSTAVTSVGNYYAPEYGYPVSNSMFQPLPNVSGYNQNNLHNGQSESNFEKGSDKYQRETRNAFHQPASNPYECYGHYPFYPATVFSSTYSPPVNPSNEITKHEPMVEISESRKSIGSRSRSVPDIVRELDEEVAEARKRARERSHNCSPALPPKAMGSGVGSPQHLPDTFVELSPSLQLMCKDISSMGFPLQRVARACDKIGVDDKKIVEYLLAVDQLMDLGFTEENVAEALIKNNCNRDKALDDLIS